MRRAARPPATQAQLALQLEQVQGALMGKTMEMSEALAALRQSAAEEKEELLRRHRCCSAGAQLGCGRARGRVRGWGVPPG